MSTNASGLVQPQRLHCRSYLQHSENNRKCLKCYFGMERIFGDGKLSTNGVCVPMVLFNLLLQLEIHSQNIRSIHYRLIHHSLTKSFQLIDSTAVSKHCSVMSYNNFFLRIIGVGEARMGMIWFMLAILSMPINDHQTNS